MTIHKTESPTLQNYCIAKNRMLKIEKLLLVLLLYHKNVSRSLQRKLIQNQL